MSSVLLYIAVFIVSAAMLYKSKIAKDEKIDVWFVLAVSLPILLAAIRDNVGTDFNNYVYIYQRNAGLSIIEWFKSNRSFSGNRFVVWFISRISGVFNSQEMFFAFFASLSILPVAIRLKQDYTESVCAICYFIYLMTLFVAGLNTCKQIAAIGILFYGLKYIHERKLFKYILVVLLATLTHITAAISIILYFFVDTKKGIFSLKKLILIIGCICVMISSPKVLELIGGRFSSYIKFEGIISNKMFFLNLLWCLLFCFLHEQYVKLNAFNDVLIMMMIIATILELTGFISPFIKRIAWYFSFPQFLLIGQFPDVVSAKKNKKYLKSIVCAYTITLFVFQYYILGQGNIIPYSCFGVAI